MARTPEQRSWDTFSGYINTARIFHKRVENMVSDGMSDVVAINRKGTTFWIENKALEIWPARPDTLPLAKRFEPGQMPFMRQWCQWGGNAFVLLRAESEYYLLDPLRDPRPMTSKEIIDSSVRIGRASIIEYLENV